MHSIFAKFKDFLQKSLSETQVFINDVWKKFHNTSQYQLKDLMDWSIYMKHL